MFTQNLFIIPLIFYMVLFQFLFLFFFYMLLKIGTILNYCPQMHQNHKRAESAES